MLQRVPSITTLSKSASNKRSFSVGLETPVQFLKGVGPKLALIFETKGIKTFEDLLYFFPREYQDRSKIWKIAELEAEEPALIQGTITGFRSVSLRFGKRPLFQATFSDGKDIMFLKWFHYNKNFLETKFKENPNVLIYGTPKLYQGKFEILHPEMDFLSDDSKTEKSGIHPIYSESEGLNQKAIRKFIEQSITLCLNQITEDLPKNILLEHKLKEKKDCIKALHNPSFENGQTVENLNSFDSLEQRRMIFEELFKFEWIVGQRRLNTRKEHTHAYPIENSTTLLEQVKKNFGFEFTDDQKSALQKIFQDLSEPRPMNRLLQGDVGCGKTLVALASSLPVIQHKSQIALLAPTEILAEQHLKTAEKVLNGLARTALLTGSTSKSKREDLYSKLLLGEIDLLVGTHAIFEDPVIFKSLGLVIIDEQHRFGVEQRLRLKAKGKNPHLLSMTATPIPRTLALTAYGDLDTTIIRQKPKNRAEITTEIYQEHDIKKAYDKITQQLKDGRQAYVIYPLVEESEKIDLQNAVDGAEYLANEVFKEFKVGLLHGKMTSSEKKQIMDRFKSGEVQLLVSTTVVEVGVDVPNSTVLLIQHSERFGLSQLHQLRGRVGRGQHHSYCFLISNTRNPVALERLKAMEQTQDGFKLAELDLEIRGPGEFLGTRQSGDLNFKYANLIRDQFILHEARNAAFDLIKKDPDLLEKENYPLRRYMEKIGRLKQRRVESC